MCDTIISQLPDGAGAIFGKNSDRERREAQAVELYPAVEFDRDTVLRCTHVQIRQSRRTHRVLLCRPFWMWGAEMGANEHGVAIGNEALFGRIPANDEPALLGMDLVRLGLERGASADEALNVIVDLLETYGQGGNCGHSAKTQYHNSFIIADCANAYVLETVGREWIVEKVDGARSISNVYSIAKKEYRASAGLDKLIQAHDPKARSVPNYAQWLEGDSPNRGGEARFARSRSLLASPEFVPSTIAMARILRDHGGEHDDHVADQPRATICAHSTSQAPHGQTVGSMICELRAGACVHWVTGTSLPCVSVFKPLLIDGDLPEHGETPGTAPDMCSLWWRHEVLNERLAGQGSAHREDFKSERDALETSFADRLIMALQEAGLAGGRAVVRQCWREADEFERRWQMRAAEAARSDVQVNSSVGPLQYHRR